MTQMRWKSLTAPGKFYCLSGNMEDGDRTDTKFTNVGKCLSFSVTLSFQGQTLGQGASSFLATAADVL